MEKKKCSRCGKRKDIVEFNFRCKQDGKRHSACNSCTKKAIQRHYAENKSAYKSRAVKHNKQKRDDHCKRLVEYLKGHPCVDCGEDDPIVLQFDHVRGKKKEDIMRMASGAYAWTTIEKEIAKCEVRCANCHTRKTAKQFNWKYKRECS